MTESTDLIIEARVDPRESEGLHAASRQLADCLSATSERVHYRVGVVVGPPDAEWPSPARPTAVVLSLLADLDRFDEPTYIASARWHASIASLRASGAPIYIRNIFRHVAARVADGKPSALQQRIRRLNRLAIDLSMETGAGLVDIDRAFADCGGRALGCDYQLGSPAADQLSGFATAACLLSFGLDHVLDPALQERAQAWHVQHNHPAQRAR